jgi:ABC-type transport system involved in multi-copper enzyme maturation permease subunit
MTAVMIAPPTVRFRLVRAELLKLRKRRGVWIPAALLTVGAIAIMYIALELFHLANAAKYGPAGGIDNFQHALLVIGQLAGMVAAVLIGASAATEDLNTSVFRDLVATGRPRTQLFLARIPGGLALLLPLVAAAYTLAAVLTAALADGRVVPSIQQLVESGLWTELTAIVFFCLALGLGSLLGSRAATISILLAWLLVLQAILRHIDALGVVRELIPSASLDHISPIAVGGPRNGVPMSATAAIIGIIAWTLIPLMLGWWRTQARDA